MSKDKELKSCIIGQAQVIFGGAVRVEFGTIGNQDAFAIGLSEFRHPAKKAGEVPPSEDTFGVQVSLIFPDIFTLINFRNILDELEALLKSRIKDVEAQQQIDFDNVDPQHIVNEHDDLLPCEEPYERKQED